MTSCVYYVIQVLYHTNRVLLAPKRTVSPFSSKLNGIIAICPPNGVHSKYSSFTYGTARCNIFFTTYYGDIIN